MGTGDGEGDETGEAFGEGEGEGGAFDASLGFGPGDTRTAVETAGVGVIGVVIPEGLECGAAVGTCRAGDLPGATPGPVPPDASVRPTTRPSTTTAIRRPA